MSPTAAYLVVTVVALATLVLVQPRGKRTIFEPAVLIVALLGVCYLVPGLTLDLMGILPPSGDYATDLISRYGLWFVVAFVPLYLICSRLPSPRIFADGSLDILWSAKACFFGSFGLLVVYKLILIAYGAAGGTDEDYTAQYLARLSMPRSVAQLLNVMNPARWILLYVMLAASYSSRRRSDLTYVWLTFAIFALDMVYTRSRSPFVAFCIAWAVAHVFYRGSIGVLRETVLGVLFVLIIGAFSFTRTAERPEITTLDILIPSEFLSVYQNAFFMAGILDTRSFVEPPGSSYLQSLVSFVPSQLNPGKWDVATWYVGTYFARFAESGGGVAFGLIPEGMINWGLASMPFQALAVALFYGLTRTRAERVRERGRDVRLVFYIYALTQTYHLVRLESFGIYGGTVMGFLVPYGALFMLSRVRFSTRPDGARA